MEMRSLVSNYGKSKCLIIDDRTEAIEYVLKEAKKGDVVIITGKGESVMNKNSQYQVNLILKRLNIC